MCHVSHRLASRGPNWIVPGASVQSTIFLVSMCQTIGMMHWTAGPHNVLSRSKAIPMTWVSPAPSPLPRQPFRAELKSSRHELCELRELHRFVMHKKPRERRNLKISQVRGGRRWQKGKHEEKACLCVCSFLLHSSTTHRR